MVKQTKSKKTENLGKGKVTPVQVAFIVDRYLSDNNYTQTRSFFRAEASNLISKTQVREAPKSLLSLDAILDEYICLKEQKVMLEQEKFQMEHEKVRVKALLQGMQEAMNAYNSKGSISPPSISAKETKPMALIPQSDQRIGSPSGYPMNRTSAATSVPWLSNHTVEPTNFSTPSTNIPSQNKRKGSRPVPDVPPTAKKACSQITSKTLPVGGTKIPLQAQNTIGTQGMVQRQCSMVKSLSRNCLPGASTVAKSLFNQPSSCIQTDSPSPKTPPQGLTSLVDKSVSPQESCSLVNCSNNNIPQEITPTNCPIISSDTVIVSPSKHLTYYSVERSHYISSPSPVKTQFKRLGTRDHVKGRLDFGASDAPMCSENHTTAEISTSAGEGLNIFDMDFPNFDIFGADLSLSEFLVDIDLECGQAMNPTTDLISGSHESGEGSFEENQTLSEFSSSLTTVLCEKDLNVQGQDSLASMKSVTKCIRILSPAKNQRSPSMDQENQLARD